MITTGSKLQVWNGTAAHTSGGLTKRDLIRKQVGPGQYRIMSRRKVESAKRNPFMQAQRKARLTEERSFTYNGNTYVRHVKKIKKGKGPKRSVVDFIYYKKRR